MIPAFSSFSAIGLAAMAGLCSLRPPIVEKLKKTGITSKYNGFGDLPLKKTGNTRKYNGLQGFEHEKDRKHKKI